MRRGELLGLSLFSLLLLRAVGGFSAEVGKSGVVKGTVTVGGRVSADAVVSVEGLPDKYLRSQISDLKSKKTQKAIIDQRELRKTIKTAKAIVSFHPAWIFQIPRFSTIPQGKPTEHGSGDTANPADDGCNDALQDRRKPRSWLDVGLKRDEDGFPGTVYRN